MKQNNPAQNREYYYESQEGIFSYYIDINKNEIDKSETIRITGCEEKGACLHIPAQINGYPVNSIGKKAFLGNRSWQRQPLF